MGHCLCGDFGFVGFAYVAVEGVAGVVGVEGGSGDGCADCVPDVGLDVIVLLAEVIHRGGFGFFFEVELDSAAVVRDAGVHLEAGVGQEGQGATPAETDYAYLGDAGLGAEVADGGIYVGDGLVLVERGDVAEAFLHGGGVVIELDAGAGSVEESWRDGEEALLGEAVGDAAHVCVDAEDFLDDYESCVSGGGGLGYIGAELEVVGGGEGDWMSHDLILV